MAFVSASLIQTHRQRMLCLIMLLDENPFIPSRCQRGRPGKASHSASARSPHFPVWCWSGRCCDCGNCAHSCLKNKATRWCNEAKRRGDTNSDSLFKMSFSSLCISHGQSWWARPSLYVTVHFSSSQFIINSLWKMQHETSDSARIRTSGRSTLTHSWQQRDDWPSLHLPHPSLPQGSWRSAQCSPE